MSAADLILVMNTTQRWAVQALFGRGSDEVLVLGDFDPEPIDAREIRDPFDQAIDAFEQSYSRIDRCVAQLVRALAPNAQRMPIRGVTPEASNGTSTQHQELPA
jgi:protein-tyrosine-phosphatase